MKGSKIHNPHEFHKLYDGLILQDTKSPKLKSVAGHAIYQIVTTKQILCRIELSTNPKKTGIVENADQFQNSTAIHCFTSIKSYSSLIVKVLIIKQ